MISEAFLQEMKDRCDIESVVSRYVNLRKSGKSMVGLCPFHSEKTPSFHVYPDDQHFYCFGCETGGDVITFIRKIENLEYREAVEFLAAQAGLTVPDDAPGAQAASRERARILEMNRAAARFFHECLISPQGKEGLAYFEQRGLSMHTIRSFGLGYAPDGWNHLLGYLQQQGFRPEELAAGALALRGRNGGYYDAFRHRVMFPIIDLRGNVVAFGGRVLDDSKPKYLNSNDTPAFHKSKCLFALNFAKNSGGRSLILCEGYMDAIALHQAGFRNAVATLGTALTPEQVRLMARYAKEVVISYDADKAGQNASQRAIGLLTQAGLAVRVLRIEGGKDPDEFIRTHGADRFRMLLEHSGNHIEYRLASALQKYNVDITEQKAAYLKEAVEILATVESMVERDVYAGKLAETLGVSKENVLADAAALRAKRQGREKKARVREEIAAAHGMKDRVNPEKRANLLAARAEENLIVLLYRNPDFLKRMDNLIRPEDFVTAFNRRVYTALREQAIAGGEPDLSALGAQFSADEMGKITGLLHKTLVSDTLQEAHDCAAVLLKEQVNRRAAEQQDAQAAYDAIRVKKLEEQR
ncbi:DNA primase [Ethanoligenens harbinense]|uniref:DNA primase n=1 Tax=Ethanoligenens harbinense (strain DSM 18485 / JCM 12961 / CGMCC 1.5033 / YUAN-3) TaxID=663278 RepID=E6U4B0_ETHHY|nr:DNA primase [Ethanoligenens harbinense]ADU26610.1 DNA primase [Ethanoligenens harbinense YUAN-3]